jgi:hypothetical protein
LKKTYLIYLIVLLGTFSYFSQPDIRVNAILDSSKIRIGEQVKIDLFVNYQASNKPLKIQWPGIGDTLTGKVEVISVSAIDTTFPDKKHPEIIQQHQQIFISAYDSGYFAIPGFKFIVNNDADNPLFTQSLMLEVHTVPTDTSITKTKDIKPILDEKFNWKWYVHYLYWALALIAFATAIVLITLYIQKKKRNKIIEPPKPRVPAHISALASLEKIKEEQIWKEGKIKEYYSSISDTVRLYIEERYGVFALESTTDEIMTAFRTQVIDPESKNKLQQILTLSDLVKFAKLMPIEVEHILTLQNAFDYVNGTKREEVVTLPTDEAIYKSESKNV